MRRLNNCCFCFTLETAGLIFGWFGFISSIIVLGIIAVVFVSIVELSKGLIEKLTKKTKFKIEFLGDFAVTGVAFLIFGIIAILLVLNIVFSRILINGVAERDATKVYKYKWFTIVMLIISIIVNFIRGLILEFFMEISDPYMIRRHGYSQPKSSAGILINGGVNVLLSIYVIYVIHSLEMLFREEQIPMVQQQVVGYQAYPQISAPYPTNNTSYPQQHISPYDAPPSLVYVNATAPFPPSNPAFNNFNEKS